MHRLTIYNNSYYPHSFDTCKVLRRLSSAISEICFEDLPVRVCKWSQARYAYLEDSSSSDGDFDEVYHSGQSVFNTHMERASWRDLDEALIGESLRGYLKKVSFVLKPLKSSGRLAREISLRSGQFLEDILSIFPGLRASGVEVVVTVALASY